MSPTIRLLAPLFCAAISLLTHCALGSRGAELPADTVARVERHVAEFQERAHVPGISVAIVVDQELVYENGFGLADLENQVPATAQTVYRTASIAKMFTAVAALQLAEQKKLDLQAPIQQYVPSFPEKEGRITAELLLKHQSGIRHYRGDEIYSAIHYNRVSDGLAIFEKDPLLFAPGTKYSYTTYGFNLLGAAIESAAGESYVDYVLVHVCMPAGMASTVPDDSRKIIPHRAAGYRQAFVAGGLVNDYAVDVSNKIPGGGWCSTAGDLARFAIALADDRLIGEPTRTAMWTRQATNSGELTRSGLGCMVGKGPAGRVISHSGGQPKVSTLLVLWPDRRAATALMCNLQGVSLQPLADRVLATVTRPATVSAANE